MVYNRDIETLAIAFPVGPMANVTRLAAYSGILYTWLVIGLTKLHLFSVFSTESERNRLSGYVRPVSGFNLTTTARWLGSFSIRTLRKFVVLPDVPNGHDLGVRNPFVENSLSRTLMVNRRRFPLWKQG